jgi:hypothetical protein
MYKYFTEVIRQIVDNSKLGICRDILGKIFEEQRFSRRGQDQSPPSMAKLAAMIAMTNLEISPKGFVDLDEPSCGSGAMVLAAAETMTEKGLSYSNQLVVRATDIDPKCVHMTYIQLSMYGIPAVVFHGNTITLKKYSKWYTPMYIMDNWVWKSPFSLTGARSREDELLKRATTPHYDAMRRCQELLESPAEYDTMNMEETQND